MTEKDYALFGTKVLNLKTQEIGLLICIWKNKFADAEIDYATCVDKQGKRYNIELDNIRGFEDDLKNKLTRETLEITYPEFRKRFAKELQTAFESYRRTQLNKYSYNFKDDNSMEYNFYNKGANKKLNLFRLF